jgi:hypothetical protein
MTATEPAQRQPGPTQHAMPVDRFERVRGTARMESARRGKKRADGYTIQADHREKDDFHGITC